MRVFGARDGISKAFSGQIKPGLAGVGGCRGDNCLAIWDGLLLGRIINAVNGLPPHAKAWALWAYTEDARSCWQAVALRWVKDQVAARPPVELGWDNMEAILTLIMLAMEDCRALYRTGRRGLSDADIAARVFGDDVAGAAQRKRLATDRPYGRLLVQVRELVDQLDREALGPVGAVVAECRQARGQVA